MKIIVKNEIKCICLYSDYNASIFSIVSSFLYFIIYKIKVEISSLLKNLFDIDQIYFI